MSARNLWEVSSFSSRTLAVRLVCGESGPPPNWSSGDYRFDHHTGELIKTNLDPRCGDQVVEINELDAGADYLLPKVLERHEVKDINLFKKCLHLSHSGLNVNDLPQILDDLDEATRRNREDIKVTQQVAAIAVA
jgi:hypothetical protein